VAWIQLPNATRVKVFGPRRARKTIKPKWMHALVGVGRKNI